METAKANKHAAAAASIGAQTTRGDALRAAMIEASAAGYYGLEQVIEKELSSMPSLP